MLLCYVLLVATRNFGKGLRNFRLNKLVPADVTELPKGFTLPEGTSPAHSARIAKCLHSMLKGGEVRLREVDPMTLSDAAANPSGEALLHKKLANCGVAAVELDWSRPEGKPIAAVRLLFGTELVD